MNPVGACRTSSDTCINDDDCGDSCIPREDWTCRGYDCVPGRPLLVDGQARTAAPRVRRDWTCSTFDELSPDPELAAHWAEVAAYEHASVASFARFTMQLLALGAPPSLVRATKRAALDEVEHARLAYGLATAYAGVPIGPDRLSFENVEYELSWRVIVEALIVEACVGETLAVAESAFAASQAHAPAIRNVLLRIVADELRHAQLAWQSLDWLLGQATIEDRCWAMTLLERTIAAAAEPSHAAAGLDRPRDGVLSPASRNRVCCSASAQALVPVARALAHRFHAAQA